MGAADHVTNDKAESTSATRPDLNNHVVSEALELLSHNAKDVGNNRLNVVKPLPQELDFQCINNIEQHQAFSCAAISTPGLTAPAEVQKCSYHADPTEPPSRAELCASIVGIREDALANITDKSSKEAIEKNVHVTRDLAASPDEVWKAIGKFDTLPWEPDLQSGSVTEKNGITTRTLNSKDGGPVFVERLVEEGPNFIQYKMESGLPLKPEGSLSIKPDGHGGSNVTWSAKIDGTDHKTVDSVSAGVTGFYADGLDALVKRFGKGS